MESIKAFLQTFHLDGLATNIFFQVTALGWLFLMVWKFLIPSLRLSKAAAEALTAQSKEIDRMINEALRRAPPIEDPKEGVPFDVYRKDLHRMVDGEISIDEFVDIWRGRKVQKRPTAAELQAMAERAAKEKTEGRPIEEEIKTRMGRSFLAEWEAHLGNGKTDPMGFAELFMLNLNEGSEESRHFHSKFVGFMKTRTWDQVLKAIRPAIKNPTPFLCGPAMWFYTEFRSKVLRDIEAYWNRFLVPKSGHVHQWVQAPRPSYGGVRFECACGEVQEGQVGTVGPSGPVGRGVTGLTGPYGGTLMYGVTGPGYPTPTGCGYSYGRSGMDYQISGGGGDSGLIEEVRRLRKDSEAGKEIINVIQETIRRMSDNFPRGVGPCPAGAPGVEGYQKFYLGQWVRVTRPTSPAVGQIGRVNEVLANEIRVLVHSKHDGSFVVGLSRGEYYAALPKVGEWWRRLKCGVHQGLDGGPVLVGPDCEWWLHSNRLEDWTCGCIEPVNYGRGE